MYPGASEIIVPAWEAGPLSVEPEVEGLSQNGESTEMGQTDDSKMEPQTPVALNQLMAGHDSTTAKAISDVYTGTQLHNRREAIRRFYSHRGGNQNE
jgi:hypothetical protein